MRNYKRINVVLMLVAMLLSIVQPFLDIQVARAAIPAIEPIEPIDIVTGTVHQGTPNSVDILGGLAGAGGYDSGDQTNTAYLKFYLPSGTDYSNAKLSLTPMDSGVTGDISNLRVNIGSSDNWVVNEGFDQPLSILPTKHIGIEKDFSKPFYIFNQFDTPISLPIGDLLTNQNINDIGSENIITLILSSPTMMDDYAVFGNISIIDYDTSPPVEAKHKVSFDVDGGSLVPEQSITHGEKASEPPAPTKVGYTFEGWYTDDERTNQYDFTNNVITANTTLYAKWKPVGYTVNFEVNGGSAVPSQSVAHGKKATVPTTPTKAGYTFEGWYTDDEGTNQYDFSTNVITANTTLYAKWEPVGYTVNFEVNGGSAVPSQSVAHGKKATVPTTPTKVGYTFEGWYTDDEGTEQYDFTNNVITANTTLYAKWKPLKYTVSFEVDGGSAVPSQSVVHGKKATVPTTPTKVGYTFEGWYTDDEGTNQYDFSTNVITANTTLYAKWEPVGYTVNFEVNGGSAVPSQSVAHGKKATVPTTPTKAGYTFEGWYTDDEGTNQYDFSTNVITANTTIYAKWKPLKYTVSFEVSGGSAVPNQTVAHGKKATVPTTPTKAGYTFEGWYTDDEGIEQYDFTNNVITANTTLYAKWKPLKYTVSFEVSGGSAVPNQTVAHGEKVTVPPVPTKTGYTFEGWYTDDEGTNQYDFSTNVITANTTIYAKWKSLKYTVSFEVSGGSAVPNQTVAHGEKATVPPAPTKAGYTFEGWYTDDEGTEQYDFTNNVITANTTLYAKWEPLKYTVSFEVGGGSAVPSQSVAHGKKATVPTTPTKVGYTFEGWYTDDEGTEQYDFTNNVITANTTLYAKWEPLKYTVSFEVEGGSAVPSQSVAHGKKATVPTTPTKVGYTFEGWYTDDEGTEQYDFTNNVITANTTLYAKWEPVGYTVNFEVNGGSAVPSQSVVHGKKATVPTTPTKVGYTFEGWYTDDEGTEQYDFTNNVITSNTTLYAKWKPLKYTVSFEVSGGSAVPSQMVAHGEKATVPPVPTKAGYTFEGWYTDDEGTNQYDFNTNVITANTTIYAKWKSLKYTVSFEVSGGSAVPNQTVAHGEKATVPPAPTKAGYTFEGWYTSSTLDKLFDFNSSSITRNVTIYAKWVSIVSPPTSNEGNESSTPSTNTEHIVVDVDGENGVNLTKTPIIRTTMPDGVIKDHVSMSEDIAKETIEKAKQLGNDTARIIIPDANDKVSEVVVDIPKSSLAQIHAGNIQLEIATMNAIISIPNVSMSNFSNDLYFRLVPIKSLEQQHQVEERILKEELIKETLQSEKVNLIGRPMTIETNMQHRPVTLTLPLPKNITQEQLNNLAIFIEHSDGTKELLRGKVVDYQKDMLGLQFEVTKFSTFSILYLPEDENVEEPTTDDVTHTPYIQGYSDGTFRPNAFVTRAQMASMFARQLTGNAIPKSNATFTDTAQHDAKDAIEFVKDASLFNGVTKTSFNPNGFITRAQMAAVAARWIEKHCVDNKNADFCKTTSEGNTFKDVSNNHWAVQAIATVNALGIMTGTTADTFNPDGNLTRAQAVKVLNRLFERQAPTEHQNPIFKDVQSNHWAFYEIQEAAVKHTHNK